MGSTDAPAVPVWSSPTATAAHAITPTTARATGIATASRATTAASLHAPNGAISARRTAAVAIVAPRDPKRRRRGFAVVVESLATASAYTAYVLDSLAAS